jgi:asparagine synthase (glutamine-hydrolysing)
MTTSNGRFVITFNGEIYNYVELREELRDLGFVFSTSSDTEVLLHGYAAWDTDLPRRLVGMFAFGIVDRLKGTLFLTRDRFGEKPLFLRVRAHDVTFASELSALSALEDNRAVDVEALAGYLSLNYVPGTRTLLSGVERLAPGTWRLFGSDGRASDGRFYDPFAVPPAIFESTEDLLRELENRLDTAVRLSLRSDVPVSIFLSGGIDSSLIAASTSRTGRLSNAYCLSINERGFSEWQGALTTARQVGVPLTRVDFDSSALDDFLDVIRHADDPLADSSAVAVWTLARATSSTNKVALSGDGGDELFGGYLTYRATEWHRAAISRLPMWVRREFARAAGWVPVREAKVSHFYKLMRFLRASHLPSSVAHLTWNGTWLAADVADIVARPYAASTRGALERVLERYPVDSAPDLQQLQALDVSEYLPNDILAKTDRMSMAHSLEVRAPMLYPPLAELALGLPSRWKTSRFGPGKRILRLLARERYGLMTADAPKQGFSIPIHQWLRGPAKTLLDDFLSPESVDSTNCLEADAVGRAVSSHLDRTRSYGWELWGLMVLVAWHRAHIQSVPRLPEAAVDMVRIPYVA